MNMKTIAPKTYMLSEEAQAGLRQLAINLGYITPWGKAKVSALLEDVGTGSILVHIPTLEEYIARKAQIDTMPIRSPLKDILHD
jgi:hypothetical protein